MKVMPSEKVKRINRIGAILCLAALLLTLTVITLPVCEFTTTLFTKKSSNTTFGDEKYLAARGEAEAALAQFQQEDPGTSAEILESTTVRTNSKGESSTLYVFTVASRQSKTGWDFIASGLTSGKVLLAMLLCAVAACAVSLASLKGCADTDCRYLSRGRQSVRGLGCWLALAAMLLMPLFSMCTVAVIQRQVLAHLSDGSVTPELLRTMDTLLYGGHAGENTATLLNSLTYQNSWTLWLLLPILAALLCGTILLCKGALGRTLARGGIYAAAILICVVVLYPYYVMLVTAFRTNAETTDMTFQHIFPTKWIWSNLTDIIDRGVLTYLGNSLLLSFGATAIALLCGIPAAYAMSRMDFKGKKVFLGFVIMSQMFSPVVLLVGISQLMNFLGLSDSVTGLMLINAAFNQAFAVWLLRGTFMAISPEMEQAACIDGCSTMSSLIRVLLPMSAPGIVTTLIFVFINAWNEYTISTVLISTPSHKPITVGITQFSSFNMIEWQYLFASALIATIPVVILFMLIEKHLVSGLTAGGVKG